MDDHKDVGMALVLISLACLWIVVTIQGCELRAIRKALTAGPVVEQEVE